MTRRRWTDQQLRDAVARSTTLREAIGALGIVPRGANYSLVKRTIVNLGIGTEHLETSRSVPFVQRSPERSLASLLVENSEVTSSALRERLIRAGLKPEHCELCGWCARNSVGRVPLELDHVNGNRHDNRIQNLRVLCPNCHSHQPTHRGLNGKKEQRARLPFKPVYVAPGGVVGVPRSSGRRRSWTDDGLREAVLDSRSFAEVLRRLDLKGGGVRMTIYRRVAELELDLSHFVGQGWRTGITTPSVPATPIDAVLVNDRWTKSSALRQRLIAEALKPACCELCGWAERSPDGRLPLELDHINGDHLDNRIENLRILCPNCHSLQPTHRGSNQQRRKRSASGGT